MNFETFFKAAPSSVDLNKIDSQWRALAPRYDVNNWVLPLPPWRYRPYTDSGPQAWQKLKNILQQADASKPFCIYIHAPFCSSKCGFCDNYSFKLGSHREEHIQDYVNHLCAELRLWSKQGNLSQRPVSTVHMGGGTPTFLGSDGLRLIAECCHENFNINSDTEWALESTVNELTSDVITTMHELGYRRLHLGVQSLEDIVRQAIGRRCSAQMVLDKIDEVRALDWIVSVDLICGLPEQSLSGFVDGIETLIAKGINGFSLYELLIYPQNQRWAEQHQLIDERRHLPNFWMFLAGANLLEETGFRKNLFNHWADDRDKNIYFTFPTRDEDLLAVGTIADGVFDNYHYRHPRYAQYLGDFADDFPALEGGLKKWAKVTFLTPYNTAVLSGNISKDVFAQLQMMSDGNEILSHWLSHQLIRVNQNNDAQLTSSGSWFAGNMLEALDTLRTN